MNNIRLKENIKSNRIVSIDYLKAIAVILVIVNHTISKDQSLKVGGPFWIKMAVPIFMIISGFTYSMSARGNRLTSIRQYFNKDLMSAKLSRLMIPYTIIIVVETILNLMISVKSPKLELNSQLIKEFLRIFLRGGLGPGSYYLPILIQLLFLFPFMLFLFKKKPYKSILLFFSIHLSFDILSNLLPISAKLYRLSIFRYLVFIIMGIALYENKNEFKFKKHFITLLSIASIIYIWACNYYGYVPKIFSKWTTTSLPTVFLALKLVTLGMKYLKMEDKNIITNIASIIGKASYHIFLVQMVCFRFGLNKVLNYMKTNIIVNCILSVIICCSIGIVFYYFEMELRQLYNRLNREL